ncbi:MAG: biotin--[acetyl-CoA-carboxylase] ligase [Gemmataceae bacterium]|nr:biotin--[acetyl-CoA-carboxylase] ligase [Gemmataceae bacterium]
MTVPSIADEPWSLSTRHLGRRVLIHAQLDSTNSLALALGHDPANHGLVIVADEQTAGRGQYGRTWQAPPGSSVLMSVLLFPPAPLRRPAVLTAWAAVAVCEVIREITGLDPKIQWPNDVYVQDRKVCGILIEQRSGGQVGQAPAAAVGIGLNVKQPAEFFEHAGLTLGGSLQSLTGSTFDHHDVARRLIRRLDDDHGRLVDGDFAVLEAHWRSRLGLVGRRVRVEALNGCHEGILVNVSLDAVELAADAEAPLRLLPEMVRHLQPII